MALATPLTAGILLALHSLVLVTVPPRVVVSVMMGMAQVVETPAFDPVGWGQA